MTKLEEAVKDFEKWGDRSNLVKALHEVVEFQRILYQWCGYAESAIEDNNASIKQLLRLANENVDLRKTIALLNKGYET